MTAFISHFTTDSIHANTRFRYTVTDVEYQRNGVSGRGFYHLSFFRPVTAKEQMTTQELAHLTAEYFDSVIGYTSLQAIVFADEELPRAHRGDGPAPGYVAVFDPVTRANHYRGDNFERGLREVIAEWSKRS